MKKTFAFFICIIITLSLAPRTFASQSEEKIYLAFGDSIAAGFGIENESETYPAIIAQKYGLSLQNLAANGARSDDMLTVIANTPAIKEASLITISIGGNDLIENNNFFLAYAVREKLCVMGLSEENAEKLIKGLKISGVFDGSVINFETVEADMESVFSSLHDNLRAAITLMRASNPDAAVIIQTLYNPYLGNPEYNIFGFDVGMLIDEYIQKINAVYFAVQNEANGNILIADVASGMNGKSEYFYTSWDFHPTAAGHAYMAEVIGGVYSKAAQTSVAPETEQTTFSIAPTTQNSARTTVSPQTLNGQTEVQTILGTPAAEPMADEKDHTTLPVIISISAVAVICICAGVMIKKNSM